MSVDQRAKLAGQFIERMHVETMENRRRSKRHPARWKVALVLDKSDGNPVILHTHSLDLSLGGVAIVSENAEPAGTEVTVLLVHPPGATGDKPKIVKARARVVSSAQGSPRSGYRLGLNFVQWTEDGQETLSNLLAAVDASRIQATAQPAAPAAPAEGTAQPASGRLARLRELAQAKLSDKEKPDRQEEINDRVSEALKRVFHYLKELSEHLNVVQPAYNGYKILGVPDFAGLTWETGRADYRARDLSPTKRLYERVTLGFRLSGKKPIRVALASPASDRLRQVLTEYKIKFTTEETRNDRGSLERTTFSFACEVAASVLLEGNFETGRITMRLNNVERFGILEHQLLPEAITEQALEEFSGFILGESHDIGQLLRKGL